MGGRVIQPQGSVSSFNIGWSSVLKSCSSVIGFRFFAQVQEDKKKKPNQVLLFVSFTSSFTRAWRADNGVCSGGAWKCVWGEDAAGHRDRGRPGHWIRWGRGVWCLPLTRGRRRQWDGLLWQVQRLCSSGQKGFIVSSLSERKNKIKKHKCWGSKTQNQGCSKMWFSCFLQSCVTCCTPWLLLTTTWKKQFHKWCLWQPEAWGTLLCLLYSDTVLIIVLAPLALTHLQCHHNTSTSGNSFLRLQTKSHVGLSTKILLTPGTEILSVALRRCLLDLSSFHLYMKWKEVGGEKRKLNHSSTHSDEKCCVAL